VGAGRRAVAALRREEGGFTLIELLVASAIGLVVVAGAMSVFLSGVKSQPRASSKVAAIQQGRYTVERIVRELRQGLEVPASPASSATHLELVTYVNATACGGPAGGTAIPCRVIYDCEGDVCTRAVAQPDGSEEGAATQVVEGLADDEVFSYAPSVADAGFIGVTLSLEADSKPVVLVDGAALRNPSEEA